MPKQQLHCPVESTFPQNKKNQKVPNFPFFRKTRHFLAPQGGFEPLTYRLGVGTVYWPHARFVPKSYCFVTLYAIFVSVIVCLCDGVYDDVLGTLLASC